MAPISWFLERTLRNLEVSSKLSSILPGKSFKHFWEGTSHVNFENVDYFWNPQFKIVWLKTAAVRSGFFGWWQIISSAYSTIFCLDSIIKVNNIAWEHSPSWRVPFRNKYSHLPRLVDDLTSVRLLTGRVLHCNPQLSSQESRSTAEATRDHLAHFSSEVKMLPSKLF